MLAVDYKFITSLPLKPNQSEQRDSALGWGCVSKGDAGFCKMVLSWVGTEGPGLDLHKLPLTSSETHMAFYRLFLDEHN